AAASASGPGWSLLTRVSLPTAVSITAVDLGSPAAYTVVVTRPDRCAGQRGIRLTLRTPSETVAQIAEAIGLQHLRVDVL
ncbi:hypothetical protein, partial [Pseudonocardia charpentierae]